MKPSRSFVVLSCAWLLWNGARGSDGAMYWVQWDAFDSRSGCVAALNEKAAKMGLSGSLFLGFAFLIAADLAAAECSWVLWSNYGTLDPTVPLALSTVSGAPANWQPIRAFDSAKACDSALEHADKQELESRFKRNENKAKGQLWDAYVYRCLPDNVDPLAPKASSK